MMQTQAGSPGRAATPPLRPIHAILLLTTSGLTTLVTAVLGPVLPQMQAHFSDVPRAEYLVPLTLTVPMLMMALLSIVAGALSDRYGRKRLLVGAVACYAVFGLAPLWLSDLKTIMASRIVLGVMDAALMTISTTMIGDYYQGARRERMQALQTTTAASLAFILNLLGGFLGEYGWRTPFWLYAVAIPMALLMAVYLWEPKPHGRAADERLAAQDVPGITFRPWLLAGICLLSFITGLVFLILPVHLGYLFNAIGVSSPAKIGIAYALNSAGVVSGTLLFGWVIATRLRVAAQLAVALALTGGGFLLMNGAASYPALTFAAVINGLGAGLLLPTVVTWNMRELPAVRRGFGTGAFQSAQFLGMFVNPVVVVGLQAQVGSRALAVSIVGAVLVAGALIALIRHLGPRGRLRNAAT
ncbi:MAG: MFS transporter [Proteobacteria bacterium]|nr:MFS transporter [Pseudomonadota bacterium]